MILTGAEIFRQVNNGKIHISPFSTSNLGPNSYDLTLAAQLMRYQREKKYVVGSILPPDRLFDLEPLDMKKDNPVELIPLFQEGLVLVPGEVYLGCTNEECGSDEYVACLEGRSSVGRLGIQVHLTAGFGDLGFSGSSQKGCQWTLEITVVRPVRVYPNVRICQAIFYKTYGERKNLYSGKYKRQHGPMPSQMWRDFLKGGSSDGEK